MYGTAAIMMISMLSIESAKTQVENAKEIVSVIEGYVQTQINADA